MLWRGALRRCPWCGDRQAYFTGWFSKTDRCRRCATPWRRGDIGFELGAVVIATIATFGAVIVAVAVGMLVTAPNFAVVPLMVLVVVIAVVVPVVVYPVSYTLWQAIDLVMRPEEDDPSAVRGSSSGPPAGTGPAVGPTPDA